MNKNVCGVCGYPKDAEREAVIMDNNPLSLVAYKENQCPECGHQIDGGTIKDRDIYNKYNKDGIDVIEMEMIK